MQPVCKLGCKPRQLLRRRSGQEVSCLGEFTYHFPVSRSAAVTKLEWSPYSSWLAVQSYDLVEGQELHLVAMKRSNAPSHSDHQQEAAAQAGSPCSIFDWLGNGSLMLSQWGRRDAESIRIYFAANRAKGCSTANGEYLLGWGMLSPCRELLLCVGPYVAMPAFSVWHTIKRNGVQLQLPQIQAAIYSDWSKRLSWSYDSSLLALSVTWQRTSGGPPDHIVRLLIYAATGRLLQALEVGPVSQLSWSPTANILAMVTEDSYKLWEASTDTWTSVAATLDLDWTSID